MAVKKGLFSLVKRLLSDAIFMTITASRMDCPLNSFFVDPQERRRRKWLQGKAHVQSLGPLVASNPSVTTGNKAEEVGLAGESNHALSMALAAAATAESAMAAAHEAGKVTEFTGTSPGSQRRKREADEPTITNIYVVAPSVAPQIEEEVRHSAAVKIQTAFRGFLARKALRALKGIVKLQAIIRGRAVRRHAITTLRRLQSIVDIHSQVCATRLPVLKSTADYSCRIKYLKEVKGCYRRWDDSLLSREDAKALLTSKREAMLRRERIREYAFNHRKSAESENRKAQGRWRYWLEQWVDTQLSRSREFEDLDPVIASNVEEHGEHVRVGSPKQRRYKQWPSNKFDTSESPSPSPQSATRRQLQKHTRQCSTGEEFSCVPALPTYMAATASAKAKARSSGSPNLRPGAYDVYSESPYKSKLSLVSSMVSEVPSIKIARSGGASGPRQRPPSLRSHSIPAATKSGRISTISCPVEAVK